MQQLRKHGKSSFLIILVTYFNIFYYSELLAYTFHHIYGLNCTGLRFFTVYGPRGRPDMAPFKFIDRVYNGHPIQQYGDGTTSRDYTYIDDIVEGVVAAIDKPLGYQVINLGNGRPFLLKDFISLVENAVGKKAIIEVSTIVIIFDLYIIIIMFVYNYRFGQNNLVMLIELVLTLQKLLRFLIIDLKYLLKKVLHVPLSGIWKLMRKDYSKRKR